MNQKPPIIWRNVFVFSSSFLLAVIGVPLYAYLYGFTAEHFIFTLFLLVYAGMSITVGYHRLWSHKTYDAHPILQFILAIGGALAMQNSALHWSSDHRVHHKFVDQNDKDPYSAKKGFWYSHIGWMLREYQAHRYHDYANCRDLQKNKIVMWQHKHYNALTLTTNIGIPIALGLFFGDVVGMFLTAGALRLVLSHHFTFFINSLAHIWGSQPYTDKNTAKDNPLLAFLTYGEGYHNYHHIFEIDYRNGIRWWQFDPSKWFIKMASYVGLTSNLKKVPEDKIQKALVDMQLKRAELRIQQLSNRKELYTRLETEYTQLITQLVNYAKAKKSYLTAKGQDLSCTRMQELKTEYKKFKKLWLEQKQQWQSLVGVYS